jgi:hypothetical protein
MSLRLSGGPYINQVFNSNTGSRTELVQNIAFYLTTNAGWTTISGGGTGDTVIQSAMTPESLQIRVRLFDPGSGNCARATLKNTGGSITSQAFYILPALNKKWRLVASPYQFFLSTPMAHVNWGEFLAAGVPALPSFLNGVTTSCGWMNGNSPGDTGGLIQSFRNGFTPGNNNYYTMWSGFRNGNLLDRTALNDWYRSGDLTLTCPIPGRTGYTEQLERWPSYPGSRWVDGSAHCGDSLLIWSGTTSANDEGKIQGQLWDALSTQVVYPCDQLVNIGGHVGITITHQGAAYAAGGSAGTNVPGTLIVLIS